MSPLDTLLAEPRASSKEIDEAGWDENPAPLRFGDILETNGGQDRDERWLSLFSLRDTPEIQ